MLLLFRILGMTVDVQNALFDYFDSTLNFITEQAKKAGKFDQGILDLCIGADGCKSSKVAEWSRQHSTGMASLSLHKLQVERGFSWQKAIEKNRRSLLDEGFYLSKNLRKAKAVAILAVCDRSEANMKKKPVSDQRYSIYKPNTGLLSKQMKLSDLEEAYSATAPEDAKDHWEEQYTAFATTCSHMFWTGVCPNVGQICECGLRTRTFHVLCGAVLDVWDKVHQVLSTDRRFHRQVVRFKTTDRLKKHVGECHKSRIEF